jgi:peptidoglycan/LPS O-acetylase OafA/YrhL
MRRIPTLDGVRGVLALIVMLVHVASFTYPSGILILSQIPVAMFFVLSGWVLTRAWDGRFGVFLARRVARLWPVYAVSLVFGYVLAWRHPIWAEFAWVPWPGYDGDVVNGPVWSLYIEAWAAPLMPLIAWSGRGPVLRAAAVGAGFAVASYWFAPLLFGCLFVIGAALSAQAPKIAFFERPPVQFLGRVSYSLYLSHWLLLKATVQFLGPWFVPLAGLAAFPLAWLVWWAVEEPSIQLSRRIGARHAP